MQDTGFETVKKLSVFVFLIYILLTGLSGCTTSHRVSMRERILNSAWHRKETKKNKEIRSLEQTLNLWIGHHISRCIQRLGPATQITDDGAGGRIYVWVEHHQRTFHNPYFVVPPKQHTSNHSHTLNVPQETTTRGTMRWDPLFERWEYESETKPTSRLPDISRTVREADRTEPQLRFKKVTENYTGRVMFYTREDGTIYHWLIITPNNHYAYNNRGNAKGDVHDYNRSLTKEEKRQYLDRIRKYDSTIYLFPDDAKAYFNRGKAKHKLGLTREAELDLRTALRLATQQGYVRLKNSIEEALRDL